jgi:hypothetical protein
VQIEVRSLDRLQGKNAVDLAPVLGALASAVKNSQLDPARIRVVCDWMQYRHNFREPIEIRTVQPSALEAARPSRIAKDENGKNHHDAYEIAIDLRRAKPEMIEAKIAQLSDGGSVSGKQYLEGWRRASESCIWDFNSLYWNALGLWEQATGQEYEQALPGGESDARNAEAARDLILELFRIWDDLSVRKALPQDLHVLELGVGNGNQARVWLDEFARLDREHRGEYYRRLHYLMGDYSPHVLERARENVNEHADHISTLVLDARTPSRTLGFLRGKAFLIYISNVYDNLPTDEVVRLGGHVFNVEVRAHVSGEAAQTIAEGLGIEPKEIPDLVTRLLQLGPELLSRAVPNLFPDPLAAVKFWGEVWEALRLEERYVPIEGLDIYDVAPGVGGEVLRPVIEANGDLRMHISNGAAASFLDSLPLLHPFGMLQCHDIILTDIEQYRRSFRGPGKYDGSVVNWVNGPLLAAIARRKGYEVSFRSFQRSGSNIITLTSRIQD